jgi:hypothetical protein
MCLLQSEVILHCIEEYRQMAVWDVDHDQDNHPIVVFPDDAL